MNEILADASTTSLVSSIEEHLFGAFATFRRWPGAEVHDEAEMLWSITEIPFALFNSILRVRLATDRIETAIQSVVARGVERNVPLLWWTGPATQPADLGRHLEEHGFVCEDQMPGMAVELAHLNEGPPMPRGFTVERVADEATLMKWSQVCAQGFGLPDFTARGFYHWVRCPGPNSIQAYLGWQNGQPVATSLLLYAAGVAGIYNVATLPEARRQGLGAILTLTPLRDARERNYKVGILQSSSMGLQVYRSLGFQEYCKIGQYVWSPEHKPESG